MKVESLFLHSGDDQPGLLQPQAAGEATSAGLEAWLAAHLHETRALLARRGALLCRGFGIAGAAEFRACAAVFGGPMASYVGGNSPRTAVGEGVFTSTEYPAHAEISVHNELSYAREWPRTLFFYCERPAASGGQTTLADGRALLASLPPSLVERFAAKGLQYIRNFAGSGLGRTWQTTYDTTDRAEAERRIHATGSTHAWLADGTLRVVTTCPALARHPDSGETVWFNQAEQWHPSALPAGLRDALSLALGADRFPHDCRHGDGTAIAEADLETIRKAQRRQHVLFDWQRGDLLLVDNINFMHGRQPFQGERRVLVAMA